MAAVQRPECLPNPSYPRTVYTQYAAIRQAGQTAKSLTEEAGPPFQKDPFLAPAKALSIQGEGASHSFEQIQDRLVN